MLPLLEKSSQLKAEILRVYDMLKIKKSLHSDEREEITGSVKYNLLVEGDKKRDLDVWILSPDPREATKRLVAILTKKMLENKLFKKMNVNNFFDAYEEFDKKKAALLGQQTPKFFMIDLEYNTDESLEDKIHIEFHVSDKMQDEAFPEILGLLDEEKEKLLEMKYFVYQELPFFWNRSSLVYRGFLAGNKTKEGILQFLKDDGYEKLVK